MTELTAALTDGGGLGRPPPPPFTHFTHAHACTRSKVKTKNEFKKKKVSPVSLGPFRSNARVLHNNKNILILLLCWKHVMAIWWSLLKGYPRVTAAEATAGSSWI